MNTVVTKVMKDWTELTALWAAATPAAVDGEEITVQASEEGAGYAIEVLQSNAAPGATDRGHVVQGVETLSLLFAAAGRKHYARAYMESAAVIATGEGITGDRGGGGRGGLAGALGPEQNEFGDSSTADRAAAEALRDTYAGANSAWLADYDGDRSFYILLTWTGGGSQLQRRNIAGDDWEDAAGIIGGPRGPGPTAAELAAGVKAFARVGGDAPGHADLAADVGIPTYVVATVAYDAARNTLTGSAYGNPPALATISLALIILPNDIDRKGEDLVLSVSGRTHGLIDFDGTTLRARDLTPGSLFQVLGSLLQAWRVTEPVTPRPQDFVVHMFMFEADNTSMTGPPDFESGTHALTQALVDGAAYHAMSASAMTPQVDWPDGFAPSRSPAAGEAANEDEIAIAHYIAVPSDARNVRGLGRGYAAAAFGEAAPRGWDGFVEPIGSADRIADEFNVSGVAHKFVRVWHSLGPDYESADPPTAWDLPYNVGDRYYVVAFEGLPTPVIS